MNATARLSTVDGRATSEILKNVATSLDALPQQQYQPKPRPNMASETQNLLNLASESVARIFEHGTDKVKKSREMCDLALQALESKRNAVNRSMAEYLAASEAVQEATEASSRALNDMIVAVETVGG